MKKTTSVTTISSSKKASIINLIEIWKYRELLLSLAARDIQVRYRQTLIGGLWAILQPFATMIVFSFFFGHLAKISSNGFPYPIFSYAGLVLWTYFANALSAASNSMVASASLITKVYFPRIIIPIASTIAGIVDYAIALIIVFALMIYYQIPLSLEILLIPLTLLMAWFLAMGLGFWLSAINVKYRDVGYVLPFFIQLLLFMTPVIYPTSIAPNFKIFLAINPLTGIIETHRSVILGFPNINWENLLISFTVTILIVISGSAYFKSVERRFADII